MCLPGQLVGDRLDLSRRLSEQLQPRRSFDTECNGGRFLNARGDNDLTDREANAVRRV